MRERHKKFNQNFLKTVKKLQRERGISDEELEAALNKKEDPDDLANSILFAMEIALRIQDERKAQGLTIEGLAERANLTVGEIQILESRPNQAGLAELVDAAKALHLTPKQLFEGLDPRNFLVDRRDEPVNTKKRKKQPR